MNSKKALVVSVFLFLASMKVIAQLRLTYGADFNKTFSSRLPALGYPQKKGNSSIPYSKAFLETGNGSFFILTTNGYQQQNFSSPWNFKNGENNIIPLLQANTFYDTTGRPPHATTIAYFNPPRTTLLNPVQHLLAAGKFVKISTSTTSANATTIVPGDTMTIAVTYKNSSSGDELNPYNKSILAFFYDGSENPHIFDDIPAGNGASPYFFDGVQVPALRMHNLEVVRARSEIPDAVLSQLSTAGTGYNKVLFIEPQYDGGAFEKNIFISMAPSHDTSHFTLSNSSFKAVLIDYRNSDAGKVSESIQPFGVDFVSRDPNEIITTPHCLDVYPIKTNKPINYAVHFDNIGAGEAKKVVVTVFVPKGITVPPGGIFPFTCMVGTRQIPVYAERSNVPQTTTPQCFVKLDPDGNKITFRITNANLAGKLSTKNQKNYSYGDILFKLYTGSTGIKQCLESKVSIVFDTNDAETDSDVINYSCKPLKCN